MTDADQKGFVPSWLHTGLDMAGFLPGLGAVPDVANAALYGAEAIPDALRGDWWGAGGNLLNGASSLFSAVPLVGDAWAAASKGRKALDVGSRLIRGSRRWGEIHEPLQEAGVNPVLSSLLASAATGGLGALRSDPLNVKSFLKNSVSHGFDDFKQNTLLSPLRQSSPIVDGVAGVFMGDDPWQYRGEGADYQPTQDMPSVAYWDTPSQTPPNMGPVQRRLTQGSYWDA